MLGDALRNRAEVIWCAKHRDSRARLPGPGLHGFVGIDVWFEPAQCSVACARVCDVSEHDESSACVQTSLRAWADSTTDITPGSYDCWPPQEPASGFPSPATAPEPLRLPSRIPPSDCDDWGGRTGAWRGTLWHGMAWQGSPRGPPGVPVLRSVRGPTVSSAGLLLLEQSPPSTVLCRVGCWPVRQLQVRLAYLGDWLPTLVEGSRSSKARSNPLCWSTSAHTGTAASRLPQMLASQAWVEGTSVVRKQPLLASQKVGHSNVGGSKGVCSDCPLIEPFVDPLGTSAPAQAPAASQRGESQTYSRTQNLHPLLRRCLLAGQPIDKVVLRAQVYKTTGTAMSQPQHDGGKLPAASVARVFTAMRCCPYPLSHTPAYDIETDVRALHGLLSPDD
ncbi:uncharacterized protein B0I36DRAFT_431396 [Microdochium trichocladiopsis]|uniref:Uncharacterized protein n=1 Tax=Microdochium trichocladiopsis TaxID=1682393 RepID=A0A9P8Y9I2_9PEZI|nr:uncharacterized protein B0I36DRAFT_431396 [Microdochium trichocladiopsis]KAH7031259.1 hypothetical protein B0I36DRAFT_431396 [Microdochium trichocladiopsis]